MVSRVDRKILFFALHNPERDRPVDVAFGHEVTRRLARLDYRREQHLHEIEDGDMLAAYCGQTGARPALRFGYVRRSRLPLKEERGQVTAIGLPPDAGLFEISHIVFFDHSVVGVEFNGLAPRIGRLNEYLQSVLPGIEPFVPWALVRHNRIERLRSLRAMWQIDLAIDRRSLTGLQQEHDPDEPVLAALRGVSRGVPSEYIRLTVGAAPYHKTAFGDAIANSVLRVAGWRDLQQFDKFQVTGPSRNTMERLQLDLLADDIVSHVSVPPIDPRTRAVDADQMWTQIARAYDENLTAIGRAGRAAPPQ